MATSSLMRVLKRLLVALLYYSGVLGLWMRRLQRQTSGTVGLVLAYHHIRDAAGGQSAPLSELESGVTLAAFLEQVAYIVRNFEVLTVSELLDRSLRQSAGTRIPLAISFDDGYRSVYSGAYPVLEKASAKATVFVPSGYVDTERRYWWLDLSRFFANATRESINRLVGELRAKQIDEKLIELLVDLQAETLAERIFWRGKIALRLDKMGEHQRQIVTEIIASLTEAKSGDEQTLVLTSSQLKKLATDGWEIGAHTVNHVELTSVDSETALQELSNDKQALESNLGVTIQGLAYPYGRFGEAAMVLARRGGYKYAVTTTSAAVTADSNCYAIPRISIGLNPTLPQFAFTLCRTLRQSWRQYSLNRGCH
ncbi:MAG: polysaccharide deacetylase family protein [bacterium]